MLRCMLLSICTCERQVQHDKEILMTNLKSMYLAGRRPHRWRLNCIRGLNPMINSIYEMRKHGVEITLHMGCPFRYFDLCV